MMPHFDYTSIIIFALFSFLSLTPSPAAEFCDSGFGYGDSGCGAPFSSSSKILIKGGTVVNAHHKELADVFIDNGIILNVRPNIKVFGSMEDVVMEIDLDPVPPAEVFEVPPPMDIDPKFHDDAKEYEALVQMYQNPFDVVQVLLDRIGFVQKDPNRLGGRPDAMVVYFRELQNTEDEFYFEIQKSDSCDYVVRRVAVKLGVAESKIRLTPNDPLSGRSVPSRKHIYYNSTGTLWDGLIFRDKVSDVVHYEVLKKPIPRPQSSDPQEKA